MKDIPADSLIKNYFPVDYIDSFSKVMVTGQALTPEDFRNLAFSRFPKWIGWLMNFRNAIVKPLGLDTATRFTDMVLDKNLHEEILGMPDKRKHSVNHVFSSPTSIINFTSKKPSYDDTRRSGRDNELLQRAQNDL